MDPTRQAIYGCIQAAFAKAGLNAITSPAQIIDWTAIDEADPTVKDQIGFFIRQCINEKLGIDPGSIVVIISTGSLQEPTMPVSDLVEAISQVMK